ncbi:uncharacterized protein PHACADRAFT_214663 [Phanerochaete carnosa HHB-10118-sp]|uniref:Cytochrome P450 n=1 Tax=Phanerochaete carnosa (strain HHB-10118-sp) TaxID=650164 RepID=K5UH21_PHACS|nr:uncharacterized protein PHACADRAFT_214663 [Phanerochaete carnosa HHB-10118-sp]EKM48781.1 hypothetical protein PHACADRAFT_214663 [Phanerochaete carnosa HHB-10118-sp]
MPRKTMFVALRDLSTKDCVLAVAVTHWIFNRREPADPRILFVLLLLVPAATSLLLFLHYGTILGTVLAFSIYHASLIFSVVLYRTSPFHPLARYPGPFLAKVTRLYWTRIALAGRQHIEIGRLFDKYGDAVRIGPNEVHFRDVSVMQAMLGSKGMPKGPMWEGRALKTPILPLVGLRDNTTHSRRRKPWNRAFSSAALKNYVPVMAKRGSQFVELLAERREVDFVHCVHMFTFDFMADALFGGGSEVMKDDDKDGMARSVKTSFLDSQIYEHLPWLASLARHIPGVGEKIKRFRAMCTQRGISRLEKGSSTKDLFYWLSNEDGSEKENPSRSLILSDSALAIIAGSDTTATVLSILVYCLLAHPETYERLQAEVDKFYPSEEDSLDPKHFSKMPYLEAVINETMRLYPVLPSGSQRSPERGSGGFFASQHFIPEWTSVRIPIWCLHRDPRNFTRPDEFWPERWLIMDGLEPHSEVLTHDMNAFVPFSFGPRNCVGKNLAMLEMKVVAVHMLQRLQLRFRKDFDPTRWEHVMEDRFNLLVAELPIVVERRF